MPVLSIYRTNIYPIRRLFLKQYSTAYFLAKTAKRLSNAEAVFKEKRGVRNPILDLTITSPNSISSSQLSTTTTSVADPDPNPDPRVFGPPGSGSISQKH